ncbi:hypothetical protein [Tomitella fengzijianii]|uniref:DUF3558 domain-containing protein n=1 Tax=Tomitella fengzijianii TaxID=2597660 RepID=A0A516X1W5_9ACTN|nr:hypothetical protein [Tomitella fengzijianii]QDQ97010.1 hypothetical protein FO059_06265 [Tomitella fengzijianii]
MARGGVLAGAVVLAGSAVAGCSDAPAPPSDAELEAITLPSPRPPPNASSDAGPCALLTGAEITQQTGATIDRTSRVAGGCVWQGLSDGTLPVVDLEVRSNGDGDVMRVYGEVERSARQGGEVQDIDGLGERAFTTSVSAPTVWWVQNGAVYGLSVMLPPGEGTRSGPTAALDLARLASSRIEG